MVTISYRGDAFSRAKGPNRARLDEMVSQGKINVIYKSNVVKFEQGVAHISQNGKNLKLKNDYTFVLAGGVAPNEFLKKAGVAVETKYGSR